MYLPDPQGNQHLVKIQAPRRLKLRAKAIKEYWIKEQATRAKLAAARAAGDRRRKERAKLAYKLKMLWRKVQFWRSWPAEVNEW